MVWTDPPYGVAVIGGDRTMNNAERIAAGGKTLQNDDLSEAELDTFLRASLGLALEHTRKGGAWYVAAPQGPLNTTFAIVLRDMGVTRAVLQWVKDSFVLGRGDYHYRNEPIFYGWRPGAPHYFVDDRTQDNVWEIPRPRRSTDHPTMKPVELVRRAIRNSSKPGELVAEPFGGSGTTLIAAAQEARVCFAIEKDPRYCDVIRRRYEELTGEAPRPLD